MTEAMPYFPGWSLPLAVDRAADAFAPLVDGARGLVEHAPMGAVALAVERGYFRPAEEDFLIDWFSRFLSVRSALWELLGELIAAHGGDLSSFESEMADDEDAWTAFGLGYGAACAIVHLDRFLVMQLATDSITQRKLNEGVAEHRIPRKQFTAVFESLADPASALFLDEAIGLRERLALRIDRDLYRPQSRLLQPVADRLSWLESSLDRSTRGFLRLFASFQSHSLRRRFASARDQGFFSLMEGSGTVVAEIRDHCQPKRVDENVRQKLADLLRPGDVLATRHERAMTNLFLPGFWPHAALYVGSASDRDRLRVEIDDERREMWSGDNRVLEALKDGVRFRPLEETLAVDAVAVIRPRLDENVIAEALSRAARHEGKGYNFDFDFFRSDRLVCTEVIYRGYDGLAGVELGLTERAGRPTLSAEDLLDLAFSSDLFEVIAVYGTAEDPTHLYVGEEAVGPLRRSYVSAD
ncbi:MAG: hypothetical protein MPN21_11510 [Thermoanaerobaculia bacterium]|nr:hypothetical protein [Thermoanaerobaculia bacterium]